MRQSLGHLFLKILPILLLAGCASLEGPRAPSESALEGIQRRYVETRDGKRSYWLQVPSHVGLEKAQPLVIVLHGHGGTGRRMMRQTGLNALAEKEGFFVAYPDGASWRGIPWGSWNAEYCCGFAKNRGVDDLAFIDLLIDDVLGAFPADPQRVSVIGVSNGGMMAYRAGCALAERLSAIGVVAGALPPGPCEPRVPLSVMIIHGTQDHYVLYDGGKSPKSGYRRRDASVKEAVGFWVEHNGLPRAPRRSEHGEVTEERYEQDGVQASVSVHTVHGGTHSWPGRHADDSFSVNEQIGEWLITRRQKQQADVASLH